MTTTSHAAAAPPGHEPHLHEPHLHEPPSAAAASLLARLDDPATAAALHDLLDHAELLALLVGMLDGLLQRSETLTGNIASGLAEVRTAVGGAPDLRAAAELLPAAAAALPALQALATSRLLRPETVGALDTLSGALVEGLAAPPPASGLRSRVASLRDPATARGLGLLLAVARALGRRTGA